MKKKQFKALRKELRKIGNHSSHEKSSSIKTGKDIKLKEPVEVISKEPLPVLVKENNWMRWMGFFTVIMALVVTIMSGFIVFKAQKRIAKQEALMEQFIVGTSELFEKQNHQSSMMIDSLQMVLTKLNSEMKKNQEATMGLFEQQSSIMKQQQILSKKNTQLFIEELQSLHTVMDSVLTQ